MDLRAFPFDVHTCVLRLSSYGHTKDDITYEWEDQIKPVSMSRSIDLAKFVISDHSIADRKVMTDTGEYSILELEVRFARHHGAYYLQFFLPIALIVALTWGTFCLERRLGLIRCLLCLVALVALLMVYDANADSMPRVAYLKSTDIYFGVSLLLVVAALCENLFTITIRGASQQEEHENLKPDPEQIYKTSGHLSGISRADRISRIIFPAIYIAFHIIYALVCLFL